MSEGGYKESYCEGYVDQQSGDSSVISAGHNLDIQAGTLTNVGSLITAGVNATINVAGPVVNQQQTLNAYWHSHWVQETSVFSPDKRHEVWGCGSAAECTALYGNAYTNVGGVIDPPTPVGNIAAAIQAPNLTVTSGGQIVNVGNVIGQSVSLTGTNLANGITKSNTYTPIVGNPPQVISLAPASGGLNLSIPATLGGYSLTQMKTTQGAQASPGSGIDYVLDGTGTTLDPVTPQLLLSNLPSNLQPSTSLFYYNPQAEDAALQTAALKQTGQATFVSGLSTDSQLQLSVTDQEKLLLYANATEYAKANDIQLGQALTQQQIGELTQPMLWYVEQTVPEPGCTAAGTATCPTVTALMPQVYLPANTSALSADGNIVASDSIKLNFGSKDTGGSVLNTGTITSDGSLAVNTGTLTNQANQVDVGQIWHYIKEAGYEETTGTQVQPGGFMSAANMSLNVQALQQIGGALQQLGADGTVNEAGTKLVLATLQQRLGSDFTQTTVSDHLHTDFVKEGGSFSSNQLAMMVVSTAMQMMGVPLWALMMMTTAVSEAGSDRGIRLGDVLEAGAVAYATAEVVPAANFSGMGSNLIGANVGATLQNIGAAAVQVGEHSAVTAGIQTALGGGSFASAFEANAIMDIAAIGAGAIGANVPGGSFESIGLHALLGCASSAALGTGCAGGAIGGAASAAFSPDFIKAIDPTGANLSSGQQAALAGFASLLGGGLAGLAGANAKGGATAAQNEALNNSGAPGDVKNSAENGGLLSKAGAFASAVGDWFKDTYGDPVGSIENWVGQFGGLAQSGVQQKMSQSPSDLAAQGVANGVTAVSGAGGGSPTAGPDLAPVGPGIGTGQAASPLTGGTSPIAPAGTPIQSSGNDSSSSVTEQGVTNGAGDSSPTLPGMNRPVRAPNPDYPPNSTVVNAMSSSQMQTMVADTRCGDCSDIASYLYRAAGGQGQVIEVAPATPNNLNVYENGALETGQSYHQVYTDGQYVYDPRVSSTPIPKGDWLQSITNTNPGGISISVVKGVK